MQRNCTTFALNPAELMGFMGVGRAILQPAHPGRFSVSRYLTRLFSVRKKSQSGPLYHLSHGQREPDGLVHFCNLETGRYQRKSRTIPWLAVLISPVRAVLVDVGMG